MTILRCQSCNAPVPLLDGVAFSCPYCGSKVVVPAEMRALFEVHAVEAEAQRQLERRFVEVATPPSWLVDIAAAVLVLVLPAVAAIAIMTLAKPSIKGPSLIVDAFALGVVPGLLPGTGLWIWSAAIHATIVRFQLALAASFGDGKQICRECGAPLELRTGAISARCAYCGTDSLIAEVATAVARLRTALGSELKTLQQAIAALKIRRRLVLGGAIVAAGLLGGMVALLVAGFGAP